MAIHASWNFTQSILLGLPNSGATFPYSIFRLSSSVKESSFSYDPFFGLEGTILSALLLTGVSIGLYFWQNKKRSIWKKIKN